MPERPNILLIMTDQQRGDCLSIERHPCLLTPNMDHLGACGTRFTRGYSTCPVCIPARRSLMSGQHPARTGMVGYAGGVEWERHPPLLPQVLRDAGYQTALVGRSMHMHPGRKRYGFEQMVDLGRGGYADDLARHAPQRFDFHATGPTPNDWTARPWPLDESLHPTNWTVTEALKWLDRRDPTAPFFLTVQFLSPHPPLVPPAFYMQRYLRAELPDPVVGDWVTPLPEGGLGEAPDSSRVHLTGEALRSARAAYFGLINHIDDQIRRLLRPLFGSGGDAQRGLGDNTLIVFTSDHGEMLGDHDRWRKSVPFEPSARVPMLVRPPANMNLPRRQVLDELVCLEDIMPTALDAAGVGVPDTVDGRSLMPLLRGERPAWRDRLHIECAPQHQTLTDGKEKYIWWVADGREQLFDLREDPLEMHDLAPDPAWPQPLAAWRARMVEQLAGRPEGFSDGRRLVAGRRYRPTLPHVSQSPDG